MADDKINNPSSDSGDFNEPIAPIDFTPVDAEHGKKPFRLSPVKIAIALVLVVFVGAAWFVLSARSVFIDVTPGTSIVSVRNPGRGCMSMTKVCACWLLTSSEVSRS